MPKKSKAKSKPKVIKQQSSKTQSYKKPLQYDVHENIKKDKIVKTNIFEMMTK